MPVMNNAQTRVIDPVLSNIAQGYRHAEHVGHALFPRVPVSLSGGQVLEFGKESFQLYNSVRAPGAATKRVQFGYMGKPYTLENHSLEGQVPREHQRDAAVSPGVDLGTRAVNSVMATESLRLEYDQAQLATAKATYGANNKTAPSTKWDAAGGDPGADIDDGREAIRSAVGLYPNTLLLSAQAFAAVRNCDAVVERFKYTSRDSITADMLAQMWDLDRVVIGKAIAFDAAGKSTDVWGKNAILAYAPSAPSGQEEPSYGYTYTMQGHPLVEQAYYENNAKSWIYPVTYERAPVITSKSSGFLLYDVVS